MQTLDEHKIIIRNIKGKIQNDHPTYTNLIELVSEMAYILDDCIEMIDNKRASQLDEYRAVAKKLADYVRYYADAYRVHVGDKFDELYWFVYKIEGQRRIIDSYFMYLERNREFKHKFYEPRRKVFLKLGVTQAFQDILDDKLDILSLSLPPGTAKTTFLKMFHSGLCGWFPNDGNLFYSHSGDITKMYYESVLDIVTNGEEYRWNDIFEDCRVVKTDARLEQITIANSSNTFKAFPNVQCTSIGSKNAGRARAQKYLLIDDLIASIEEALNPRRLDTIYTKYSVDGRQRKLDGCKEIHVATRWSLLDVIGRIQKAFQDSDRCKFIAYPCFDPITHESNFMYEVEGFTTEFYLDIQKLMDDVSFRCLYMNEPIEREGLLFQEQNLRRYTELPDYEPDEILGQCDCKAKGTDFMAMPVLYRYGEDYYLVDAVCNRDTDYEKQYEDLANMLVDHEVQNAEFESNQGGDRVAEEVSKRVSEKGWICNITTKPTETNKEARIYQCSNWIIQHIIFKSKEKYSPKSDYGIFMNQLCTYSVSGKNPNDDIPDVLSNFALRMKRKNGKKKARIRKSPIR